MNLSRFRLDALLRTEKTKRESRSIFNFELKCDTSPPAEPVIAEAPSEQVFNNTFERSLSGAEEVVMAMPSSFGRWGKVHATSRHLRVETAPSLARRSLATLTNGHSDST
ncbi:hypothetical protein pipiens_017305 [Culex pipiens pipiens]|uniref:Uncharacterized protein n=1 Tax=Culex pipiens pipiens TaxID=38569 RepID=A0ABD1CH78_CULPP